MKKPTTGTSFEFVLSWMEKAERNARQQNRNDSAALWKDAIDHLKYLNHENKRLAALLAITDQQ